MKKFTPFLIIVGILLNGISHNTLSLNDEKDSFPPKIAWERIVNIQHYDSWKINFVEKTSDGGYIATGEVVKDAPGNFFGFIWDVLLVKINSNGYVEWFHIYETPENERGLCVRQTNDGGYILVGYKLFNYIEGYVWLFKTDSKGDMEWEKLYDSGIGAWDFGRSVCQTSDGGYLIIGCLTNKRICGSLANWSAPTNASIIKTDVTGKEIWRKAFFEDQGFFGCSFKSMEKTSDGGYIVTGTGYMVENDPIYFHPIEIGSILLLKLDHNCNELWRRIYFPSGEEYTYPVEGFDWISLCATSVQQMSDGNYLVSGEKSSRENCASITSMNRKLTIITDIDGNVKWNNSFSAACTQLDLDDVEKLPVCRREKWLGTRIVVVP